MDVLKQSTAQNRSKPINEIAIPAQNENAQIIRDLTRANASIQLRMISMALGLRTTNGEQP